VYRWYRSFLDRASTDDLKQLSLSLLLPVFIFGLFTTRDDPPAWAWPLTGLALLPCLAFAVPWIARTQSAPDRLPIDWGDRFWLLIGFGIGSFLLGAPLSVVGVLSIWSGAILFILGCVFLGLVIRHVRKPVRPAPTPQPNPGGWDEPPRKGWRMFR